MVRKSSVLQLPQSVRHQLDNLLIEGKMTLDQLREFIALHDGVEQAPSRSALGRYAAEFKETAAALRESREIARGIAQELGPQSVEGEQGRILVEMLRSFLFRALQAKVNDQEATFDAGELGKMARSLRDLSQAMRLEQGFAGQLKEEARKEAESKMEAATKEALTGAAGQDLNPQAIFTRIQAIYRGEA